MEEQTLKVGDEFTTYEDFKAAQLKHENATYTLLVSADSRGLSVSRRNNITSDDVNNLRYSSITLKCKHYGQAKGGEVRDTSTYKCGCIYQINVVATKNENDQAVLRVVAITDRHLNHVPSKEAYDSYPAVRQRSLNAASQFVNSALNVKSNIRLVQSVVNRDPNRTGGKVIMKDLYNQRAKLKKQENSADGVDDLTALIEEMEKIENSTVKVITDNDSNVEGIYFQDENMKKVYSAYPEIIFSDATHNVNDRNMPLEVIMVADGEGESQIVALFIIRSESAAVTRQMFEIFTAENQATDKLQVIMADKHATNLSVFPIVFPNAQLHICTFHIGEIFNRRITTKQMKITEQVKKDSLQILRKMIYCKSEVEYLELYGDLERIASDELMQYFNTNWHPEEMRKTWTGYHIDKISHFHNRSNARSESFNQKLKAVLSRYGSLKGFFKETLLVIESMTDEREHRTIVHLEKHPTKKRDVEPFVHQYHDLLTHFAFTKLKTHFDEYQNVQFGRHDDEEQCAFIFFGDRFTKTTANDCTCNFYTTMSLPCKHIMKFRSEYRQNLFERRLCHTRWHKATLTSVAKRTVTPSTETEVIHLPRANTKKEKFHRTDSLLKTISNLLVDLPQAKFETYINELTKCRDFISNGTIFSGRMNYIYLKKKNKT